MADAIKFICPSVARTARPRCVAPLDVISHPADPILLTDRSQGNGNDMTPLNVYVIHFILIIYY